MYAVGIDIGTTTISAVVLDADSREVVCAKTIPNGSFIHTKNEWERIQNAEMIIEKAKAVLDELLEKYPDAVSIGLTGQMHGIVYVDAQGSALSPLYTWQDGRGNLPDESGEALTDRVKRCCGITAATGYGLITHLYHTEHNLVPEGAVSICTIADYFGMALTGRKSPLVHSSNAASLGFYDGSRGRFLETELSACGADPAILPEVSEKSEVLGKYRGIPVTIALGDNQASFLGSVGMQEQGVLLNMGTGGQISVLSDRYFEAPGIEARPFVKGKYLLVGASLCGGRAYAILESFFRSYQKAAGEADKPQYDIMERLAEQGMQNANRSNKIDMEIHRSADPAEYDRVDNELRVMTTFNGTRTNPMLRGSITGISEDNFTPENLVYGTLCGMARELYEMYRTIQAGREAQEEVKTGEKRDIHNTGAGKPQRLIASGNGLRKNRILRQIFSEMFGAELVLAPYEEEAACGAAICGLDGKE